MGMSCLLALASGLSALTALCDLALTAHQERAYEGEPLPQEHCDASDAIASLTKLELSYLDEVLALGHCYQHLQPLSGLRSLILLTEDFGGILERGLPGQRPAASVCADMLQGMPSLTYLSLYCPACGGLVHYSSGDGASCRHIACTHCEWEC